jgi:hypothetical protein
MPVMTHLLRQSGINPYHKRYNPDALDDFDPSNCTTNLDYARLGDRYVILSIEPFRLVEVINASKELNQQYRDGGRDNDYLSPTDILEKLVHSDRDLDDVLEEFSEEIHGEIE